MIENGKNIDYWTNNLVSAHALGFNSGDSFQDLKDYFKYVEDRMLNIDENDLFYKTKTKLWKKRHLNEVKFLKDNIVGFDTIKNISENSKKKILGVYIWEINDIVYYVGE